MKRLIKNTHGSVLVMVLWALSLLAVFAIQISAMTQDKIAFLARQERINVLRNAAESGIFKALSIIRSEPFKNKIKNPLQRMLTLYYNPLSFRELSFGTAQTSVGYNQTGDFLENYGVTDEARRLNINVADRESIRKLLLALEVATEDQADTISAAIYDWREIGASEIKGFASDDFYENLEFAYPQKKGKYETLDELKLVEGISEKIYETLVDYVTIYGGEETNINTVSWPVLVALGLSDEEAKAAVAIRAGADGRQGTLDDFFYEDRNMLIAKVSQVLSLKDEAADEFSRIIQRIPFVTDSNIFRVQSYASFALRKENLSITCVFDATDDKILFWRRY